MMDLYLRFADADEMRRELLAAGFQVDDGGDIYHPHVSMNILGELVSTEIINPGEEGEIIKCTTLPGYHINLRVNNPALELGALRQYMVNPSAPYCVWA